MELLPCNPGSEIFDPPDFTLYRDPWQDLEIWKEIFEYPKPIKLYFLTLRKDLKMYISGDWKKLYSNTNPFPISFLKKFYYQLCKTDCLKSSYLKAGGLALNLGFKWAQFILRKYYLNHRNKPIVQFRYYDTFRYYCRKGVFRDYGITHISELLEAALSDLLLFDCNDRKFDSQEDLQRIISYMQEMHEYIGRIPLKQDKGMKFFVKAIRRGDLVKLGIRDWSDLLWKSFGIESRESVYWEGKGGLNLAKACIQEYLKNHHHFPKIHQDGFDGIYRSIKKSYWSDMGISSWDDLLEECLKS